MNLILVQARIDNRNLDPEKFIASIKNNLTDDYEFDGTNTITHKETGKKFIVNKDYSISAMKEINTKEDLMNIEPNGNYILTSDIDLSGINWTPLPSFTGTFDGNNHCINGMTIDSPGGISVALFLELNGGVIKNLALTNVDVNSYRNAAGIVCHVTNNAIVENCFVSGNFTLTAYAGGIACNIGNNGIIRNCYTTCDFNISVRDGLWASVGGIASYCAWEDTYGIIENCYSTSDITADGPYVGGIIGYNEYNNNIRNCYALNESMYGAIISRVIGNNMGINNYAYNNMLINDNPIVSSDVNSSNGGDITSENATSQSHYENISNWKFDENGPWTFDYSNMKVESGTNLPVLKTFTNVMQSPKISM